MVISSFALLASVTNAQVLDTNLEITEFRMAPSTTQAGANPNVSLFSRFCGPGLAITDVQPAPTAGRFRITTATPHGVQPFNFVKIRGVRTVADVNGLWTATQVSGDTDTFEVVSRIRPPDGDDAFAPGAHAQIAARTNPYGCVGDQPSGKLARLQLKLPPGFLANPTALEACPTHLFIASSCSDRSIVGHSVSENMVDGGSEATPPVRVPTPVYNVQTLGLEPARFGGTQFPSEPAGPFPVTVRIRSTGDYGVDTAVIDIPRNLAGPQAVISQIETVLCAQVPCKATDQLDAATVQPLAPTRPFFRNPTSCNPATGQLEARSWAANAVTRVATNTFIPTGCEAVPFTPWSR